MPKRGRRATTATKLEQENKKGLKSIIENLDEKSRKKIDYLLRDFKLQRQDNLVNIQECKQHYLNMIDAYFDKMPKIIPRRYLLMKSANFDLANAYLIIDYKKFLDKALLSNLNRKKEILKYGGTPAKFKVTYSATRRKSQAKNEIKHFEFTRLSATGNTKTIITSAKKSTKKRSIIERRNLINKEDQSSKLIIKSQNSTTDSNFDEKEQLKHKMKLFKLSKIKENRNQLINEIQDKHVKIIDNLFKKIINSLTKEQANKKITTQEQNRIIEHICG